MPNPMILIKLSGTRWFRASSRGLGDNENLPAAIARCLGLANVHLDEMFRHRALELCQTGTLEEFDDEVAAGLQRSGSKFECQLSQMNAPRLIDAVDTRQVGGHVG